MAMDKQMELFEPVERGFDEGGLMDEGGSVDPVSGNDVPTGSTQEEVRDDIPAQLSEGEFVLPADVVRFHGLEKIMALRDEAKAGLQKMEDMGQMGNSEEATLPDDVPFSMDDLEMEDDGVAEYQVGGYVPPQNVAFQQSQFAGYQPQIAQPVTQPSTTPTYQAPTQQFTPTQNVAAPSFAAFAQPSSVTYYHADGRTITVPVDSSGNPLIPVPAGFSATKPTAAAPTTPTTAAPTYQAPQQAQSDDNGLDPRVVEQQEKYKQTINERTKAAEELGYTNKQSVLDAVLPFVLPGGSLLMPKPERGTVLVDGTIADGTGGSFDPISGEKVGAFGGALSNIKSALGLEDKSEIAKKAEEMGVSPASLEGLKTVKGEQSIQDLLDQAGTTSTPVKDIETTSTPMDAAETVGVETALVTEKGTAGKIAQKAADIQSALDLTDMSEKEKIDFLDSVIEGKPAQEKLVDREGNPVEFTSGETPEDVSSQAAAAQKMKDDIVREAEERREAAKETGAEKLQAVKDAAAAYGVSTKGKSVEQIQKDIASEQKRRADAAAARAAADRARTGGPNIFGGFDDDGGGIQSAYDSGRSGTSFGGAGYETSTGEAMVAKGGLMDKDKLAKQMKQSGLASKK